MVFKRGKGSKESVESGTTPSAIDSPKRISNKLEHVLVAESKVSRGDSMKRKIKRFLSDKKRVRWGSAALVALILLAAAAYIVGSKEKPKVVTDDGPKCSYAILEKSKKLLDPKQVEKLQPIAQEIEAIPGYDTDANCLYVVLTYYINISDAAKSRELYDKLAKVYDAQEGYETVIVDAAQKPEVLKPIVEFLEKQSSQSQDIGPDGAPR